MISNGLVFDLEKEELAATLRGSLLEFIKTFFPLITGHPFLLSNPPGRESHFVTVSKSLTRAFDLKIPSHRLLINIPPGYGKSVMVSMWVAWSMASYPDSNFLYISYSKGLSAKHTEFIRRVMTSRYYKYLFDVRVREDSRAKDLFKTEAGGTVGAYGAAGAITGQDAGLPNLDRFSGAVIMDDAHKPDEVHSDNVRQKVIDNYQETIMQRKRGTKVPFIYIGQRLHEADLPAFLIEKKDGYAWEQIILKAIDDAGNALYPENFPLEDLFMLKEHNPYVFYSQQQQEPVPAGGALFKRNDFVLLDNEPKILKTFITADTAETTKSWNDATVFSFWGIYEIESMGRKINQLGLHWLDCLEIRVEPKDLKEEFINFYTECVRHPVPPLVAAIEKKSTGVTLVSILEDLRGLKIRKIERAGAKNSKSERFPAMQPFIAGKYLSFTKGAKHVEKCIAHMIKITANDSHRHDDIADTCSDAIQLGLIDKSLYFNDNAKDSRKEIVQDIKASLIRRQNGGWKLNA